MFLLIEYLNEYLNRYYYFISPKYYYEFSYIRFCNDYAVIIIPKLTEDNKKSFLKWHKKYYAHFYNHIFSNSFSYYRNTWRIRLMLNF